MRSTRTKRTWTVIGGGLAAAGLAVTVALAGPAAADEPPTDPTPAGSGEHPRICDRLERAQDRGERLVLRLQADDGTRGSIAWLEARAQEASAAGNTERATRLAERAAWRTDVLARVQAVAPDLDALIAAHCG